MIRNTKWTQVGSFSKESIPRELQGRRGVVFTPAVIDQTVGEEVLLLIVDPSLTKKEVSRLGGLRVDLGLGMVDTDAGSVGFSVFSIPNGDLGGEPFAAYEQPFNPQDPRSVEPYRRLAEQSHWHYLVVGRGLNVLDVLEFENRFGLHTALPAVTSAAAQMPMVDFQLALAVYREQYTVLDLLRIASGADEDEPDAYDELEPDPLPAAAQTYDNITLAIERESIESRDVSPVVNFIRRFDRAPDAGRSHFGRLDLCVSGYDHDPRPLHATPEVRAWFVTLLKAVPDLMFFVNPRGTTPRVIMHCVIQLEPVGARGFRVRPSDAQAFLDYALAGIRTRFAKVGIDPAGAEAQAFVKQLVGALSA